MLTFRGACDGLSFVLSPGGFAHVYLVKTKEKLQGRDLHVLKRVAVRDRKLLDEVRREVEVMVSCCFFRSNLARKERRVRASAPDRRKGTIGHYYNARAGRESLLETRVLKAAC